MLPKMNPKQMAQMMKQFGISTREIDAEKVVIHRKDGTLMEIRNPSVVAMDMQGQTNFQISGDVTETGSASEDKEEKPAESESPADSLEDDIRMVMEQAKVSRDEAISALGKCNGNIAEAIVSARGDGE